MPTATGVQGTSPSVTPTSSPTATPEVSGCPGDCNGDLRVSVDELVRGVTIALDRATLDVCPSFDVRANGSVSVDELVGAVNAALNGCP